MFKNKNVILYLLYTLFSSISFISPYLNLYLTKQFNFNLSDISIALIVYQVTKLIFEIPTGVISDKYGKKLSVVTGNVLIIFSYFLLLLNIKTLVYISLFFKGLGYTFISGSFQALFINSLDKQYLSKINCIERIFFYFGVGISSILGGIIISILNFNTIIGLDILILFFMFIISTLIKEEKCVKINSNKLIKNSIKLIFNKKFLKYFLLMDLVTVISFINLEDFYSTFLNNKGLDIKLIGVIIALQFFISSLIGYAIHNFYKKLNKTKTYIIYSLLEIIFALCIYISNNILFICTFYILQLLCFSIFSPIKYEMFQSDITNNLRSTILSIKSLIISLGGIISYFIVFLLRKYFVLTHITIILLIVTLFGYIFINIKLFKSIKNFYKHN